jgi:hypothetical protein
MPTNPLKSENPFCTSPPLDGPSASPYTGAGPPGYGATFVVLSGAGGVAPNDPCGSSGCGASPGCCGSGGGGPGPGGGLPRWPGGGRGFVLQ